MKISATPRRIGNRLDISNAAACSMSVLINLLLSKVRCRSNHASVRSYRILWDASHSCGRFDNALAVGWRNQSKQPKWVTLGGC